MSAPATFTFDDFDLRVVDRNGQPWFPLRDVLRAMGSKTSRHDAKLQIEEGLGDGYVTDTPILDSLGRPQQVTIVAEAGATFLVSRSRTERGRRLNRFLHGTVLPSIRRTGGYIAGQESVETVEEMAELFISFTKRWVAERTEAIPHGEDAASASRSEAQNLHEMLESVSDATALAQTSVENQRQRADRVLHTIEKEARSEALRLINEGRSSRRRRKRRK